MKECESLDPKRTTALELGQKKNSGTRGDTDGLTNVHRRLCDRTVNPDAAACDIDKVRPQTRDFREGGVEGAVKCNEGRKPKSGAAVENDTQRRAHQTRECLMQSR